MHITIIAVGSQGDVQPYVALGVGLKSAGHHVQIATLSNYKEFVESYGLSFAEVKGNPREWLETPDGLAWIESGPSTLGFYQGLKRFMSPVLETLLPTTFAACRQSDLILYSTLAASGPHIGEKLNRPSFPVMLQPVYSTGEFASVLAYSTKKAPAAYNKLTHFIADQILWQAMRTPINEWRRTHLALSPSPLLGPTPRLREEKVPQFLAYSQHVLPRPKDWAEHIHVTGYWFLNRQSSWEPPAELVRFLEGGSPPVYIGFGSMTSRDPEQTTRKVVKALELSGQRGILLSGWSGLGGHGLPDTVYCVKSVPHDWLFPRVAAVVHHGGAGTTASGLRAGVPSILTPFFADQFFWAKRVAALGVGPNYIPHSSLTAEGLAEAVRAATQNPGMIHQAKQLGEKIRAENGVETAVHMLEKLMRSHPQAKQGRRPAV